MTGPQKAVWRPIRDSIKHANSQYWKANSTLAIGYLRKAVRSKTALMGGAIRKNKDGIVNAVSLKATKLAPKQATKGKGKGAAKPSQIAAKLPKAGNAVNPATV